LEVFDSCYSAVQPFTASLSKLTTVQPFSHSTSVIQKFLSVVQPFDFCRSKIFFSHSAVNLIHSKIFSAIQPHPFKNLLSSVVQPFSVSVLNSLWTCFLAVHLACVQPFERIPKGTFSHHRSQVAVNKSLKYF